MECKIRRLSLEERNQWIKLRLSPCPLAVFQVTFFEWAPGGFELVAQTQHVIEDCLAPPHDFIFTDDYYVFMHYRFKLELAPFLLGLKGPAECMVCTTWISISD